MAVKVKDQSGEEHVFDNAHFTVTQFGSVIITKGTEEIGYFPNVLYARVI